mmetsp:Transcript_4428/g.5144  ORF Transcript_4428/g.5144 Transcript_4428/m.5144 type:complete len:320 (+) Transcript_4428:131-1090(+)
MEQSQESKMKEVPLVFQVFEEWKDKVAVPVAAIKALTILIQETKEETMMGLEIELRTAADVLRKQATISNSSSICSLEAGCELFLRYVTRSSAILDLTRKDIKEIKQILVERGRNFADLSMKSRSKVSELGRSFISNGETILLHGNSKVVQKLLIDAANVNLKNFSVIITEGRPSMSGIECAKTLQSEGIPVRVIQDAAVGFFMEQVDMVLVGAEGVVENGGIVNKIGTYQMSLIAKACKTPFYVATESYKFTRMFPINQGELKDLNGRGSSPSVDEHGIKLDSPVVDFTPPHFITLLFTDLGVLTPSAVSDELIKMYL